MMNDNTLQQRLLKFGWRLEETHGEWVLEGNGSPAAFRTVESLADWLEHQERAVKKPVEPEQLVMDFAA